MLEKSKYLTALLLCTVVLSPQFLMSTTTQTKPTIIDVKTMSNIKTMIVLGAPLTFNEFIRIEQWSNGSKTVHISERIIVNAPDCQEVCVNMTQTISEEDIKKARNPITITKLVQPCSGTFPGKYTWDGMVFLPKGNNGTMIAEYTYDDNFDTYFPMEWFTYWDLIGIKLYHVHIDAQTISNWISGLQSKADILAVTFAALGGGLSIIGGIAAFFECPWGAAVAIIGGICAILDAFILYILKIQEIQWATNVVQTWYGDGFTWLSGVLSSSIGVFRNPYFTAPMMEWWAYQFRDWDQSWGAERDNWQHYCVTWEPPTHLRTAALSSSIHEPPW
jgi:hypothetical protein